MPFYVLHADAGTTEGLINVYLDSPTLYLSRLFRILLFHLFKRSMLQNVSRLVVIKEENRHEEEGRRCRRRRRGGKAEKVWRENGGKTR